MILQCPAQLIRPMYSLLTGLPGDNYRLHPLKTPAVKGSEQRLVIGTVLWIIRRALCENGVQFFAWPNPALRFRAHTVMQAEMAVHERPRLTLGVAYINSSAEHHRASVRKGIEIGPQSVLLGTETVQLFCRCGSLCSRLTPCRWVPAEPRGPPPPRLAGKLSRPFGKGSWADSCTLRR